MSYYDKAKFLALFGYEVLKGNIGWDPIQGKYYPPPNQHRSRFKGFRRAVKQKTKRIMPPRRKRKAKYQRRGAVKKRYKRSRKGFSGKGLGRKKGNYRRFHTTRIPRSKTLFPAIMRVPMHFHIDGKIQTGAAGIPNSLHVRMGSIWDPIVSVGGGANRTTEWNIVNKIYNNYVVKSCYVNWKCRYLSTPNTTEVLRLWVYNDDTGTTVPTFANLERFSDKSLAVKKPVKWRHISKEKNLTTVKQKFYPYKQTSVGRLIQEHGALMAANPTEAHNAVIVVSNQEAVGVAGVQYDLWVTYDVICYSPDTLTVDAAPE